MELRGAPSVLLFGGLAVGDSVVHPPAGAAWRIVAWLSLYRHAQRDELADALWPDATGARARGNLRTGLWRARTQFPGLLEERGSVVRLAARTVVDLTLAVATARSVLETDAPPDPRELHGLVEDPPLLPGWYDDWVLEERERFRLLRVHALERAARRLTAHGQFGTATEAAVAAIRSDPLRESAHRALIEVHLSEGNVAEARRQFGVYSKLLAHELATRPSEALETLVLGTSRDTGVTAV